MRLRICGTTISAPVKRKAGSSKAHTQSSANCFSHSAERVRVASDRLRSKIDGAVGAGLDTPGFGLKRGLPASCSTWAMAFSANAPSNFGAFSAINCPEMADSTSSGFFFQVFSQASSRRATRRSGSKSRLDHCSLSQVRTTCPLGLTWVTQRSINLPQSRRAACWISNRFGQEKRYMPKV